MINSFVDNIFILTQSGIKTINNSKDISKIHYDNILYNAFNENTSVVNRKLNEYKIKHGLKLILDTGSIPWYYTENRSYNKTSGFSENTYQLIDNLIHDCGNIVTLSTYANLLPMKDDIRIFSILYPIDFNLYLSSRYSYNELDYQKNYDYLNIQIFSKFNTLKNILDTLELLNNYKTIIARVKILYNFRNLFSPGFLRLKRDFPFFLDFLIQIIRIGSKIDFQLRFLKFNEYYEAIHQNNALIIQQDGGLGAIIDAILNELLIFNNFSSNSLNNKILVNDFNITVFDLVDFQNELYTLNDLESILIKNKQNMLGVIEKSRDFYKDLFSSNNVGSTY